MTGRITRDPARMFGKPCITGTRITVEYTLRRLAVCDTVADVIRHYPQLTIDDIRAALVYAADFMALAHMTDRLADEASKPKYQPPTEEAP